MNKIFASPRKTLELLSWWIFNFSDEMSEGFMMNFSSLRSYRGNMLNGKKFLFTEHFSSSQDNVTHFHRLSPAINLYQGNFFIRNYFTANHRVPLHRESNQKFLLPFFHFSWITFSDFASIFHRLTWDGEWRGNFWN